MPISTVLAGHSHIDALVGGYKLAPAFELRPIDGAEGACAFVGPNPRNEVFWERLIQEAPGRNVGFAWNGNEHNSMYFFIPCISSGPTRSSTSFRVTYRD